MSDEETITDLFEPESSETEEATSVETETSKESTDEGKGETEEGSEEKTETTEESEPPSEEDSETQSVPRDALIDERRKRQALEQELESIRQQVPKREDLPDPYDDPEGYKKAVREQVEQEYAEKEQQRTVERANESRAKMLEKHKDYVEKENYFYAMAQQDPKLVEELKSHPDPAAFAYDKAKEKLDEQERALEQRVIEKLKSEGKYVEAKAKEDEAKQAATSVSELANTAGAGKNSEEKVELPENPADYF